MKNFTEKVKELFTKHQIASIAVTSVVLVAAITITTAFVLLKRPIQTAEIVDDSSSDTSSINVIVPDIIKESTSSDTSSQNALSIDVSGDVNVSSGNNAQSTTQTPSNILPTSLGVNKANVTLNTGESFQIKVTFNPTSTTDKSLVYSSSNSSVATVSGGVIAAVGAGSCSITATSTANSSVSRTINVTVNQPASPDPTPDPTPDPAPQTSTPSTPSTDNHVCGPTGQICPKCGKEIWGYIDGGYCYPSFDGGSEYCPGTCMLSFG